MFGAERKMEKFEGATTAIITPMTRGGEVDFHGLEKLIKFNIKNGIHNLVACGTTGQSPNLSDEEWGKVVSNCVGQSQKEEHETGRKVHIIAGAGSNSFDKAKKLTQFAEELGADATLHVTGYYNMAPQSGMKDHFSACASASKLPLIMYDVPARGHPTIKPAMRIEAALANPGKIIGVKDATGGEYIEEGEKKNMWEWTAKYARESGLDRHQFKLISGDDPKTWEIMSQYEGVGVISVTSNIFPQAVSRMAELLLEGKNEEAKSIDDALAPFNNVLKIKGVSYYLPVSGRRVKDDTFANPAPVQYAAYVLGMIRTDRLELPLIGLSEEHTPMGDRVVPSEARMRVLRALEVMYNSDMRELLFKPIEEFYKVDVEARLTLMREPSRE